MGLAEFERKRDEKIDGVIYDMSPVPGYQHGMVNGNIFAFIKQGLSELSRGALDNFLICNNAEIMIK